MNTLPESAILIRSGTYNLRGAGRSLGADPSASTLSPRFDHYGPHQSKFLPRFVTAPALQHAQPDSLVLIRSGTDNLPGDGRRLGAGSETIWPRPDLHVILQTLRRSSSIPLETTLSGLANLLSSGFFPLES